MKTKLLFSLILGACFIGCSVDPIQEEISNDVIKQSNIHVNNEPYGCAGPDRSKTLTLSEAASIESWDEVRKLYLSLLDSGVAKDGTFDPSIWNLIDAFNEKEYPIGTYTAIYSLASGTCSDSVELTIEVVPDFSDPICTISAGTDASKEITYSEAASIESWDEVRKLYLSLLEPGIPRNGTFDPSIWDLINAFNNSDDPLGDYTTTYTITNGECTASVELTVTVVADFSDPVCTISAGSDNMKTLTYSEAAAIESWDEVRKLYLSLLDTGVPRDGTFDPSIWDMINAFNNNTDPLGDYTTTYTVTDGECSDSVELTIRVVAD